MSYVLYISDTGTHHTNPTADFMISTQMNSSQTINNTQPIPQSSLMNGSIQPNTSYLPYQNITGYSTTSVYGQPLMTPGTAGGVPIAGSGQLWFPGQSSMYDTTMHYHKTGSGAGYVSLPNHSWFPFHCFVYLLYGVCVIFLTLFYCWLYQLTLKHFLFSFVCTCDHE